MAAPLTPMQWTAARAIAATRNAARRSAKRARDDDATISTALATKLAVWRAHFGDRLRSPAWANYWRLKPTQARTEREAMERLELIERVRGSHEYRITTTTTRKP